jgi:hypothetical protein
MPADKYNFAPAMASLKACARSPAGDHIATVIYEVSASVLGEKIL